MDTTVVATFLEYSPNPTWLADSDGRCVYANQALADITARTVAQLGELNWLALVAAEDRDLSSAVWRDAQSDHVPYRTRLIFEARDSFRGSVMDVVGTGHIAPDGAELWLFTAVASPPGKRVRERFTLATEVATGAQLSTAIAHEIVQPLSALVANARAALHWLEGDDKDVARAASLLEIVVRDGMSIGNVVHEIREL